MNGAIGYILSKNAIKDISNDKNNSSKLLKDELYEV